MSHSPLTGPDQFRILFLGDGTRHDLKRNPLVRVSEDEEGWAEDDANGDANGNHKSREGRASRFKDICCPGNIGLLVTQNMTMRAR